MIFPRFIVQETLTLIACLRLRLRLQLAVVDLSLVDEGNVFEKISRIDVLVLVRVRVRKLRQLLWRGKLFEQELRPD